MVSQSVIPVGVGLHLAIGLGRADNACQALLERDDLGNR